jgi:hypothetical protein
VRECLINKIGPEAGAVYDTAESHIEIGNLLFVPCSYSRANARVPPWAVLEDIFAGDEWRDDCVKDGDDWHWA